MSFREPPPPRTRPRSSVTSSVTTSFPAWPAWTHRCWPWWAARPGPASRPSCPRSFAGMWPGPRRSAPPRAAPCCCTHRPTPPGSTPTGSWGLCRACAWTPTHRRARPPITRPESLSCGPARGCPRDWRSWTHPTSTPWSRTTGTWLPRSWPGRTCGSSSPRRPATPTPFPGSTCGPRPSGTSRPRSSWTAYRRARRSRWRPTCGAGSRRRTWPRHPSSRFPRPLWTMTASCPSPASRRCASGWGRWPPTRLLARTSRTAA